MMGTTNIVWIMSLVAAFTIVLFVNLTSIVDVTNFEKRIDEGEDAIILIHNNQPHMPAVSATASRDTSSAPSKSIKRIRAVTTSPEELVVDPVDGSSCIFATKLSDKCSCSKSNVYITMYHKGGGNSLVEGVGAKLQKVRDAYLVSAALGIPFIAPASYLDASEFIGRHKVGKYGRFFDLGGSMEPDCNEQLLLEQNYETVELYEEMSGANIYDLGEMCDVMYNAVGSEYFFEPNYSNAKVMGAILARYVKSSPEHKLFTTLSKAAMKRAASGKPVVFVLPYNRDRLKGIECGRMPIALDYNRRFQADMALENPELRQPLVYDSNMINIAIHFRWGDVGTGDVNKPDKRALPLSTVIDTLDAMTGAESNLGDAYAIYFFVEGDPALFTQLTDKYPNIVFRVGTGESTKSDIDHMAHADIFIGGVSSFASMAATLNFGHSITIVPMSENKYSHLQYEGTMDDVLDVYNFSITKFNKLLEDMDYFESRSWLEESGGGI